MLRKNNKQIGEKGERIAIGELAKFDIDVLIPMSDNLPYDFVIPMNNKFYRCQVKSSTITNENCVGSIRYSLTSNNWYKRNIHKYTKNEVDIIICCDFKHIYLFKMEDVEGRSYITIRTEKSRNNQIKNMTFSEDCILSEKRIKEVFT